MRVDENGSVAGDFGHRGCVGSDDGSVGLESFNNGDSEAFEEGGVNQSGGGG